MQCDYEILNNINFFLYLENTLFPYKFIVPRKFLFYLLEIVAQLVNPTNQVLLCGIHFLAQQGQDLTEGTY